SLAFPPIKRAAIQWRQVQRLLHIEHPRKEQNLCAHHDEHRIQNRAWTTNPCHQNYHAYFKCLLQSISNHIAKKSDCKPEIIKKAAKRALVVATVPINKRYKKRYSPKILPAGNNVRPIA